MPQYEQLVAILPIVLLGIRTAMKEDLNAMAVELIYGTGIRLPAEFFLLATSQTTSDFVNRVRECIDEIKPQTIIRHGTHKVFVFRELASIPCIFLRNDTVKGPLQPPYDGPYKVIEHGDKNFKISINNKNTKVSIDRLKPAFILPDEIEQQLNERDTEPPGIIVHPITRTEQNIVPETPREENAQEWYVTCSGRHVRFPDRYQAGRS
jgi:hypothetical protein